MKRHLRQNTIKYSLQKKSTPRKQSQRQNKRFIKKNSPFLKVFKLASKMLNEKQKKTKQQKQNKTKQKNKKQK